MNRQALLIAGGVSALLISSASGYGYHRDELYFLAAGHHLAWAYADQGPLTPLIARLMSETSSGSLPVLRLPSAIAAGGTVLLTGLLAYELSTSTLPPSGLAKSRSRPSPDRLGDGEPAAAHEHGPLGEASGGVVVGDEDQGQSARVPERS
jgi:hypothetical protein